MAIVKGCIAITKNLQAYCARYGAPEKSINHLSFSVHQQFRFGHSEDLTKSRHFS